MPVFESPLAVTEILSTPVGDLISSVGKGIAEAQQALDEQAIENFKRIYDGETEALQELKSLGYQPTWYQIPEASAEMRIALTLTGEAAEQQRSSTPSIPVRKRLKLLAAPVDARYSTRYNFQAEASTKLVFRIVPVPPPAAAAELHVVPDVTDMKVSDARDLLDSLGIPYSFTYTGETLPEDGVVASQSILPGRILPPGDRLGLSVQ